MVLFENRAKSRGPFPRAGESVCQRRSVCAPETQTNRLDIDNEEGFSLKIISTWCVQEPGASFGADLARCLRYNQSMREGGTSNV